MKPYESYKETDQLWLNNIPNHWNIIKTKYLFTERSQKGYPNEPLLVASQNMGVVPKGVYGNRTVEATKDLHLLKLVKTGDFVISLRSFQGGIEYAYYQGIISPAYTVMTSNNTITNDYFRHLAKSKTFIELLQMCVTGIREGQNIDYGKLKNFRLPVPPREEQDQIVKYLDWQISKINKLIKAKKKQIELLNEQKQAVINKAVTKGLDDTVPMKDSGVDWIGEIPEDWEVISLRRAIKTVKTGGTPQGADEKYYSDDGFPWYTPGDFTENIYVNSSQRMLSRLGKENVTVFPEGAVLMIGIGGTMGKVCISNTECSCNQQVNAIICNDKILNTFLAFYLRAKKQQIFDTAKFTTLPILNQEETKKILIPLLSIDEQHMIVSHIKSKSAKLDTFIDEIKEEIELMVEYKTSLISSVVTAKVDVRDVVVPDFEVVEEVAENIENDEEEMEV